MGLIPGKCSCKHWGKCECGKYSHKYLYAEGQLRAIRTSRDYLFAFSKEDLDGPTRTTPNTPNTAS